MLHECLDGLTEEQARRRLVASKTTLLGLVKNATFVEKVWFGEAVTRRPRVELGIPADPDESFDLTDGDSIRTVRSAHLDACAASRRAVVGLELDDLLQGTSGGHPEGPGRIFGLSASIPSAAGTRYWETR